MFQDGCNVTGPFFFYTKNPTERKCQQESFISTKLHWRDFMPLKMARALEAVSEQGGKALEYKARQVKSQYFIKYTLATC